MVYINVNLSLISLLPLYRFVYANSDTPSLSHPVITLYWRSLATLGDWLSPGKTAKRFGGRFVYADGDSLS